MRRERSSFLERFVFGTAIVMALMLGYYAYSHWNSGRGLTLMTAPASSPLPEGIPPPMPEDDDGAVSMIPAMRMDPEPARKRRRPGKKISRSVPAP